MMAVTLPLGMSISTPSKIVLAPWEKWRLRILTSGSLLFTEGFLLVSLSMVYVWGIVAVRERGVKQRLARTVNY
jgi:hypothetical protein